jgi:hypothetical protein
MLATSAPSSAACFCRLRSRRQAAEHVCWRPRSSTRPQTGHAEPTRTPSGSVRTLSGGTSGAPSGFPLESSAEHARSKCVALPEGTPHLGCLPSRLTSGIFTGYGPSPGPPPSNFPGTPESLAGDHCPLMRAENFPREIILNLPRAPSPPCPPLDSIFSIRGWGYLLRYRAMGGPGAWSFWNARAGWTAGQPRSRSSSAPAACGAGACFHSSRRRSRSRRSSSTRRQPGGRIAWSRPLARYCQRRRTGMPE